MFLSEDLISALFIFDLTIGACLMEVKIVVAIYVPRFVFGIIYFVVEILSSNSHF
jgi:hypothetical protein